MLKINDIHNPKDGHLQIDEYVPFSFQAYEGVLLEPFIWHSGDLSNTLLELTIDQDSKEILGVTLTLYNKPLGRSFPSPFHSIETKSGLPVVNINDFKTPIYED